MRACACLWGGFYNPIIPVFRSAPKEWREPQNRTRGYAVARGYVDFFEPDVFVEAEEGLLEAAGLQHAQITTPVHPNVVTLRDFFASVGSRQEAEPAFGLDVFDVFKDLYRTERRFELREARDAVLVRRLPGTGLAEAVFGVYPSGGDLAYISEGYVDVFQPTKAACDPQTWTKVYQSGAITPLRATRHGLDVERRRHDDLILFVFNPTRATDLIDLWNLRLEPRPVIPVPEPWCETLRDCLQEIVADEHRPLQGNPHGVMHHTTLEFARSIGEERSQNIAAELCAGLPQRALICKYWRNRIWEPVSNQRIERNRRLTVTAQERRTTLVVREQDGISTSFRTLTPTFASRFGGHEIRWVNALRTNAYYSLPTSIALTLPFNVQDRHWPKHRYFFAPNPLIGSEGWVFGQRYQDWTESIALLRHDEAIVQSLERWKISAGSSEPGFIARQMLEHLGGLINAHLLADPKVIKLLNKMAGGLRRRSNATETVEETFERRTVPIREWQNLVEKIKARSLAALSVEDFTKRNIIRLGLETRCPNCQAINWHGLDTVSYSLNCERCLNTYSFPQAGLKDRNENWAYRVVGPFSVPDYGRGSYGALLALRFLNIVNAPDVEMTFSTALNLTFDGINAEADYVAWFSQKGSHRDMPPKPIVGEAKSIGNKDLIKPKDIEQLMKIGRKLPSVILVVSVLRETFTATEKQLLAKLVQWGRRADAYGHAVNPVILLTGRELFLRGSLNKVWEALGEPYSRFTDHQHTATLTNLADATQQIHLDLPSLFNQRENEKVRRARRKDRIGH